MNDVWSHEGDQPAGGLIEDGASAPGVLLLGVPLDCNGGIENETQGLRPRLALLPDGRTHVDDPVLSLHSFANPVKGPQNPLSPAFIHDHDMHDVVIPRATALPA